MNDGCIVLADLVDKIQPGNMRQLPASFFKFSQCHMGDG